MKELNLYEGTERLLATPLRLGDYSTYRGWTIPDNESPEEPGYLVERVAQGPPNHPCHTGHVSWYPEKVFEQLYRAVDPLPEYQLRTQSEKTALDGKLLALNAFLSSPMFNTPLPVAEQSRLKEQAGVMHRYSEILAERIANF